MISEVIDEQTYKKHSELNGENINMMTQLADTVVSQLRNEFTYIRQVLDKQQEAIDEIQLACADFINGYRKAKKIDEQDQLADKQRKESKDGAIKDEHVADPYPEFERHNTDIVYSGTDDDKKDMMP